MDFKTAIVTISETAQNTGRTAEDSYRSILKKREGEVYEFVSTLPFERQMLLLDAVERRVG